MSDPLFDTLQSEMSSAGAVPTLDRLIEQLRKEFPRLIVATLSPWGALDARGDAAARRRMAVRVVHAPQRQQKSVRARGAKSPSLSGGKGGCEVRQQIRGKGGCEVCPKIPV